MTKSVSLLLGSHKLTYWFGEDCIIHYKSFLDEEVNLLL